MQCTNEGSVRNVHLAKKVARRSGSRERVPAAGVTAVSQSLNPVQGARVFPLGENGTEITLGVTDAEGHLDLPFVETSAQPAYVLVEHPRFFIGGVPWAGMQGDYRISIAGFAMR
jgi:hypothetical protein